MGLEQLYQHIIQQLRASWRRRWWLIPVAWAVCLVGWAYINTLPDVYQSSSRVYVNSQTVLEPLLRGMTVRPDTEQRVRMMTVTLLSNDNLREIARQADLDVLLNQDNEQALIGTLRGGIQLDGGRRDNIYTIAFSHRDPEVAYRVVRETSNLFMERGLGDSRVDLASSQTFIERQLQRYASQLQNKEAELESFKRENHSLLSAGGNYYTRLERARDALEQAQLERDEHAQRLETLQARLEKDRQSPIAEDAHLSNPRLDQRISRLESQLDEMRRHFTDAHPDVAQTRRILKELEERRREETRMALADPARSVEGVVGSPLRLALVDAESHAASLETRVQEHKRRVENIAALVDQVPAIESRFNALKRDHEVLQQSYRQLLTTRERAAMTGSVETETAAVDFRVLEPPTRPSSPSAPDRPLLASGVLLLGLGAGSGLAYLLAQLRGTVTSTARLAEITRRPVLGSVTRVPTPNRRRRQRLELMIFAGILGTLFVAYLMVLAYYGGGGLWPF
ncbi:XrtA system polysaccharide chain length determinant [Halorhodospira halophila]|uniref:Lipopolysaccharide biosynthesis n=1 Tax=Halorhodospira halophila (strain DSM 244 / SL1) TaxID=349124 RepID=A1WX62_HALHL|nr:XrtA system polysaccharide chain length determinant [Halorhodospira halophila]ABM62274.1 lipopolysaccharide biosynthesis [Halorhodospira halophila SL1]MBK1729249.1 lipopolysaccharide biosynthesis protein [Halorhodospira halophila]